MFPGFSLNKDINRGLLFQFDEFSEMCTIYIRCFDNQREGGKLQFIIKQPSLIKHRKQSLFPVPTKRREEGVFCEFC